MPASQLIAPPKPAVNREQIWSLVDYDPHEGQLEMHNDNSRFKLPCCGRRFGKSTWAVRDFWPYYFIPKSNHWIVGPTYELGEREFEVLFNDVMAIPAIANHKQTSISYSPQAGNMKIIFPWGAMVKVVSSEKPKSLLGKGLTTAIMSEAARHEELTWTQYIRPALSDKRGLASFPSTPRSFNWYYNYFERGQDPAQTNWASWQHPSWHNTHIYEGPDDEEFIEIRENTSDMLFRQEYGAEFVAYQGRIYEEFNPQVHVMDLQDIVAKNIGMWKNFWTIDFGYSNPFACLDVMVDTMDNVYVWREHYLSGLPTMKHAELLKNRENPQGFHVNAIFADPAGADQIATLALVLGQVYARKVGWFQGVEQLKVLLKHDPDRGRPRLVVDRSCRNLIREMQMLHFIENTKPGQQNSKEMQHSVNDHACDALRYFVNEYFILGAGVALSKVYKYAENMGQSDSYFTYPTPVTIDRQGLTWPT